MQIVAVPEPASVVWAVAFGLLGFAFYRRSRAKAGGQ
jgi:hypothetical protein